MPQRQAIDMRVRPPAPGFETLGLYWGKPRIIGMTRDVGFEPPPSYVAHSLSEYLARWRRPALRSRSSRVGWQVSGWGA